MKLSTDNTIRVTYVFIMVVLFNVAVSALELKTRTVVHPDFDVTVEGEIVEKN